MFATLCVRGALALGLILAAAAMPRVAAASTPGQVSASSRGAHHARALTDMIQAAQLSSDLAADLDVLIAETRSAAGDGEALLDTATLMVRRLGKAAGEIDRGFLEGFTREYASLLAVSAGDDWEYDIEPYPLRKCDANFNCVLARSIFCLRVLWTGPDGSGGVNCMTVNPEG